MSIEQSDSVDFIGMDKETNSVSLIISDHLSWSNEYQHLMLLQNKINSYLRFVESGEVFESFPDAKGRRVLIEVVGKYDLSEKARDFIQQARAAVESAGLDLRFRRLASE